jgi:hypothetical protein
MVKFRSWGEPVAADGEVERNSGGFTPSVRGSVLNDQEGEETVTVPFLATTDQL